MWPLGEGLVFGGAPSDVKSVCVLGGLSEGNLYLRRRSMCSDSQTNKTGSCGQISVLVTCNCWFETRAWWLFSPFATPWNVKMTYKMNFSLNTFPTISKSGNWVVTLPHKMGALNAEGFLTAHHNPEHKTNHSTSGEQENLCRIRHLAEPRECDSWGKKNSVMFILPGCHQKVGIFKSLGMCNTHVIDFFSAIHAALCV